MEETILTANALKFRYDPEQPDYALNGVSVGVRRGEFVAVLGANGCGKSTLAKHFNAILLPESGTVLVEGMDTRDEEKIYDIRQKVGMVFQSPDNQIVATVVEEDVAFALENLGVPPEEMRRRVDDAMKMAGIYEYRKRAPHNLSGGQKQRVAIAGVVAMRPDCLILDEATAMLDPRGREQVMQTIHRLNKDLGITVVAITHYMEEAADADYVVILDSGRIAAQGTPLTLKNTYTGDFITLYGAEEALVRQMGAPYETIRDAYRVSVPNTAAATELILQYPAIFQDYEITKGKMDDVFLAVTGKKLIGGAGR